MVKSIEAILIGSEKAARLAKFYKEKVGLKVTFEAVMGEKNEVYEFDMKGCSLYIMDHSKITGQNKQPSRIMFNLEVDNIEKEFNRMKKASVKVIQEIYHIEDYGHVATFEDPDGNYFQIVKTHA